ncbi:MAG: hypothetical protein BWK80_52945 [Desulfobacteraceae bacterium IS3]|nr:MAG: hypothetical protein BWK80_52945 [Desulfobacteraceae bacterium IS3]
MQAILNVKLSEIDERLLNIIKELLSENIEIVIKREFFRLEEYDKTLPLKQAMKDFEKAGYSEAFLKDLKKGLETSTVYADKNEKTVTNHYN